MASRGAFFDSVEALALMGSFVPNPVVKGLSILMGVVVASIPVRRPKPMDNSQSYGWSHDPNKTSSQGTPMPVIYGKTRVKPVLKNRYVKMDGDRQWLYALYSFAGHAIDKRVVAMWETNHVYAVGDEVTADPALWNDQEGRTFICICPHRSNRVIPLVRVGSEWRGTLVRDNAVNTFLWRAGPGLAAITDIEINGNPIANYDPESLKYETRPGTPDQSMISEFNVTYQNNYQGVALKPFTDLWSNVATYHTGEMAYWPAGGSPRHLYESTAESTNKEPPNASYWADRGEIPNPLDWTLLSTWPDLAFADTTISTPGGTKLYVDINFPNGLYSIWDGNALHSKNVHIYVFYKLSTDAWSAAHCVNLLTNNTLTKETRKAFHWTYEWEVPSGTYDVRVFYTVGQPAQASSNIYSVCDAELANVASLVYDPFTYPGEPLLGIKVLATEKLQGDIDLTAVCERSKVWVYTGAAWAEKDANNHAWAVYDLLTQGDPNHYTFNPTDTEHALPPYGCGIPYARVDYTTFAAWAAYIETLLDGDGYELNIVFDDFTTIWDAILMICFEGRGVVLPYGAKYYAVIDGPAAASALLCEGNIVADTLTQAWGDRTRRVNSIEVTYKDASRGYDDVTFIARSTNWDQTDAMRQTLYGTTAYSQAYRIAKYFLDCNEALARIINLTLDVEGLGLAVGDVVMVQHQAINLGVGGRIIAYAVDITSPYIDLDRTVTLAAGVTYGITTRNAAGVIETHTDLIVAAGATTRLRFSSAWTSAPEIYSPYAFGTDGAYYALFRVIEARRAGDMKRTVTLLEYNAAVYDIDGVADDDLPDYGVGKTAPDIFNDATHLTLTESLSKRPTGEYQSNINVTWTPEEMGMWGEWEVVFRDLDAGEPNWIGEWVAVSGGYNQGDMVTLDGNAYISLTDANIATPSTIL